METRIAEEAAAEDHDHEAFENAMGVVMVLGGSTNAVLCAGARGGGGGGVLYGQLGDRRPVDL